MMTGWMEGRNGVWMVQLEGRKELEEMLVVVEELEDVEEIGWRL